MRECALIAKSVISRNHPILAHIIPMRRCNLACTYCNEYDTTSLPVPLAIMLERVNQLASLGLSLIVFSGGEPMLHKQLETIIAHAKKCGMLVGLITNGYCLTVRRIHQLNAAGLDYLQISIDNVKPDDVSEKSLTILQPKLELLAKHALFDVNINTVIGSGVKHPEDSLAISKMAVKLGFSFTFGIIHDGLGQLTPLNPAEKMIYEQLKTIGRKGWTRFRRFQENLVEGKANNWKCRAGSRYLYICEEGLIHYCSQQRGFPGIPLSLYSKQHLKREFNQAKSCAPFCTIGCVHAVSILDKWRA